LSKPKATRVLYLDLDGTVRHGFDELGRFVNSPDDVVIFPEALTLIRRYKLMGYRIVGISNQGGIALGHLSMDECSFAMLKTNDLCGQMFDKMAWCQHHPDAKDPEFARCWCRKPRIGLIVEACASLGRAMDEFYPPHLALFVGDRPEDEQCAANANIDFMWAKDWRGLAHKTHTLVL
jgi:D-glycero-D-manno-heptose 1,7-bisphosphate phosphatase